MKKVKDLTGQRFGRLVVLSRAEDFVCNGRKYTRWNCLCDCGKESAVVGSNLKQGKTTSCGCYEKEQWRKAVVKHGQHDTKLYRIWSGMKSRCYNQKVKHYPRYDGRGIKVCDEWLHDFMSFYEWSMKNGYKEDSYRSECTIDRIDVSGDYCPENCRWVDMKTQANNRRPRTRRVAE